MSGFVEHLFRILLHLGGWGLVIVGVLDSSFLFMPLGNDLLVVAMTANSRSYLKVPFYAGMATIGSVLGCLLLDALARKGGEEALEKHVPKKRLDYVRKKINKRAAWALAVASLMPPPFPFTVFVAAASALEYPRKKLLGTIAVARMARFSIEGTLAMLFGEHILRLAKTPAVRWAIIGLIVVSVVGSALSIYRWISQSRAKRPAQ